MQKLSICQFVGIVNCQKNKNSIKMFKKEIRKTCQFVHLSICPFVNLSQLSIFQFIEIVHLLICRNCELSKKNLKKKIAWDRKVEKLVNLSICQFVTIVNLSKKKKCLRKKRRKTCQFDHMSICRNCKFSKKKIKRKKI